MAGQADTHTEPSEVGRVTQLGGQPAEHERQPGRRTERLQVVAGLHPDQRDAVDAGRTVGLDAGNGFGATAQPDRAL